MANKVIVKRAPTDYEEGVVDINSIYGVDWDNVSGGVHKRQAGYSLYGYISYSVAKEIGIACSGEHDFGDNDAKICIPASVNKGEYKEGYKELLKMAPPKPQSQLSQSRPAGQGPCTKKILHILSESGEQERGNLRMTIKELGYKTTTFSNAIKSLLKQKKIITEGSSSSIHQIIKLNKGE